MFNELYLYDRKIIKKNKAVAMAPRVYFNFDFSFV